MDFDTHQYLDGDNPQETSQGEDFVAESLAKTLLLRDHFRKGTFQPWQSVEESLETFGSVTLEGEAGDVTVRGREYLNEAIVEYSPEEGVDYREAGDMDRVTPDEVDVSSSGYAWKVGSNEFDGVEAGRIAEQIEALDQAYKEAR